MNLSNLDRPKRVAAICDGGMFPTFICDDLVFVKGFSSLSLWRFENCKMVDPTCADCCECLGSVGCASKGASRGK